MLLMYFVVLLSLTESNVLPLSSFLTLLMLLCKDNLLRDELLSVPPLYFHSLIAS
jgi:hypothetical protein